MKRLNGVIVFAGLGGGVCVRARLSGPNSQLLVIFLIITQHPVAPSFRRSRVSFLIRLITSLSFNVHPRRSLTCKTAKEYRYMTKICFPIQDRTNRFAFNTRADFFSQSTEPF